MLESGPELKSSGIKPHVFFPFLSLLLACVPIYLLVGTMNRGRKLSGGGIGTVESENPIGVPGRMQPFSLNYLAIWQSTPKSLLALCHGSCFRLEVPSIS